MQDLPTGGGMFRKSVEARKSCNLINLSRDAGLNGKFLYHFARCLSDLDENNEETIPGIFNLVTSIGIEGMQAVSDVLKIELEGSERDKNSKYPIMEMLSVLMERGVYQNGTVQNDLINSRFSDFQIFLERFNPYYSINLFLLANEDKSLPKTLSSLNNLWDNIEEESIIALGRTVLEKKEARNSIVNSLSSVFDNEVVYNSLKEMMIFEKSPSLKRVEQDECFKKWLVPLRRDNGEIVEGDNCDFSEVDEESGHLNGKDRWNSFIEKIGDSKTENVSKFISSIIKEIMNIESGKRKAILQSLLDGGKKSYMEHGGLLRNLIALLDLFEKTNAKDFDFVGDAVLKVLEAKDYFPLKMGNIKVGYSKMHSKIEDLIYLGGVVPGCNKLNLDGLKTLDLGESSAGYNKWINLLESYFLPNEQCLNLSPVASLVFYELNKENKCDELVDTDNPEKLRFCVNLKEQELLGAELKKDSFVEKRNDEIIGSILLKKLVLSAIDEAKDELARDQYYFRWNRLAPGAISLETIERLRKLVSDQSELTVQKISKTDEEIQNDNYFKIRIFPNVLEKLIELKISKLSSSLYYFNNNLRAGNEDKLYRLLTGFYTNGPIEQIYKSEMYYDKLQSRYQGVMPADTFRVKEFLGRFRVSNVLFKNDFIDEEDRAYSFKFPGAKKCTVKFPNNQVKFTSSKPLSILDVFNGRSGKSNSVLRVAKMLENSDLVGKDILQSESENFTLWVKKGLYEYLVDKSSWIWPKVIKNIRENGFDLKQIDSDFFDVNPYSKNEFAKIALFNSIQYLAIPMFLPDSAKQYDYVKSKIRSEFRSLTVAPGNNFRSFLKYYPEHFNFENAVDGKRKFSEILDSILKDVKKEDFIKFYGESTPWDISKNDEDGVYYHNNITEADKKILDIFVTFNLLTRNKKSQVMPTLGIGQSCWLNTETKERCPITFKDSEEAGDSFENLKSYMKKIVLTEFCPYFASESESFLMNLEQELGIVFDKQEYYDFCNRNDINFYTHKKGAKKEAKIPQIIQKVVLKDILTMGKSSGFKPGIVNLISRIKYFKLHKKYKKRKEVFARKWMNRGTLKYDLQIYPDKKISDHKGYLTNFSGRINKYISYLKAKTNIITKKSGSSSVIEMSFVRYGAETPPHIHSERGLTYDFLVNFLLKNQKYSSDLDESFLKMVIRLLNNWENHPNRDKYIDLVSNLLVYPENFETLDLFNVLMDFLVKRIREIQEQDELQVTSPWDDTGMYIIKQLLREEFWYALSDLTFEFSNYKPEVKNGLSNIITIFSQLGTISSSEEIANELIQFLRSEYMSVKSVGEKNDVMVRVFEKGFKKIFEAEYPEGQIQNVNYLIDLFKMGHRGFDDENRRYYDIISQMDKIIFWGLKNYLNIMEDYQKTMKGFHFNYFRSLVNSFLSPLKNYKEVDSGTSELLEIFKDKRVGSWKKLFKPMIFSNKKLQSKVFNLLSSVNRGKINDYEQAISEINLILPKTHKFLNYVINRIEWNDDISEDSIYGIGMMERVSRPANLVLDKQIDLINKWFFLAREAKKL